MKIFAISGLGADHRVFQKLKLDYEIIPIKWIQPNSNEPIIEYSKRLISKYNLDTEINFGIMGVSFGGLIATEITKLTSPKFTVLISSAETRSEIPFFARLIGKLKIIKIIPEKFLNPPKKLAHYLFGTKEKELLNSILNDSDANFTKWAVTELLNWNNQSRLTNLIKVGGSKDKILPEKGKKSIIIDHGEHFMIVDKAKEISKVLNEQIKRYT